MKKFILAFAVVVVIGALVYLSRAGLIPGWQTLSIVFAAVAAPFKLLMSLFGDKEAEIRAAHAKLREQEGDYQANLDSRIQSRQLSVDKLNQDIQAIDGRIDELRQRRENIDQQVEQMGLEELQSEGRRLFR